MLLHVHSEISEPESAPKCGSLNKRYLRVHHRACSNLGARACGDMYNASFRVVALSSMQDFLPCNCWGQMQFEMYLQAAACRHA
eukprot:4881225-Pleurochrysis_carterae.AAC.4